MNVINGGWCNLRPVIIVTTDVVNDKFDKECR